MAKRLRACGMAVRLLMVVVALSMVARAALIDQPCRVPCRSVVDHVPIFDETYYLGAAHVIAGLAPLRGERYAGSPRGDDPNAEHPQLAKLVIAGSIELLGDGPWAWRLPSILAGTAALLGLFALVRAAGGSDAEAAIAGTLMAADNLMIVHGRIGTLDMPVVAAMEWAVALYLRGRPLRAGILLGIGACIKLVAPYALLVVVGFELLRGRGSLVGASRRGRAVAGRIAAMAMAGVGTLLLLLEALDWLAPPYDAGSGRLVTGGALGHIAHMLRYASLEVSPHGPRGIASYPWQWLIDLKPIIYLNIDPANPAPGLGGIRPAAHFLGFISPPILLLGLPALAWAGWQCLWGPGQPTLPGAPRSVLAPGADGVPRLAVAWVAGTFLPFAALSLLLTRTSYLYYMLVVLPGLYVAAARAAVLLSRRHRSVIALWAVAVGAAAVLLYPFTPVP